MDEVQCARLDFERALDQLQAGYVEGDFKGRRWGATIKRSADNRRIWLYAEDLAGTDIVSFNLYVFFNGEYALKPCEMSSSKVTEFVVGFKPSRVEAELLPIRSSA